MTWVRAKTSDEDAAGSGRAATKSSAFDPVPPEASTKTLGASKSRKALVQWFKCEQPTPGDDVAVRAHRDVLGCGVCVAHCSFKTAGFRYCKGAGVGRQHIDDVHRTFGSMGARELQHSLGIIEPVAAAMSCGHQFSHSFNQEGAAGTMKRLRTPNRRLHRFAVAQQGRHWRRLLAANKFFERGDRTSGNPKWHGRYRPSEHKHRGHPVKESRLCWMKCEKSMGMI